MFKNSQKIAFIRGMVGRRSERRTKPSLEHLDARIALSGVSAVMSPAYLHVPISNPTHNPFMVSAPPEKMSPPIGILTGGDPGHEPGTIVPDNGGFSR